MRSVLLRLVLASCLTVSFVTASTVGWTEPAGAEVTVNITSSGSVSEGGLLEFTVTVSGSWSWPYFGGVRTRGVGEGDPIPPGALPTATPWADYESITPPEGLFSFSGPGVKTWTVQTNADSNVEPDEFFWFEVRGDGFLYGKVSGDIRDAGAATTTTTTTTTTPPVTPQTSSRSGYWMAELDGTLYAYGDAPTVSVVPGAAPVMAVEPTRDGRGLWILTSDGRVHVRGTAQYHGDVNTAAAQPVGTTAAALDPGELPTALSATPDGGGYWIFTDRGRAITFGNAQFYGDVSNLALNGPIIASVATPSGNGYYMIATDGGVFTQGDARFYGSTGDLVLNEPVVGVAPDPDRTGYWLVARDGGIFTFETIFRGSMGGIPLNQPVIGAVAFADGYLMVASDGGIFNFSGEPFYGSLGSNPPDTPIVGVAAFAT